MGIIDRSSNDLSGISQDRSISVESWWKMILATPDILSIQANTLLFQKNSLKVLHDRISLSTLGMFDHLGPRYL